MTKRTPTNHSLDKAIFRRTAKATRAINSLGVSVMRGGIRL